MTQVNTMVDAAPSIPDRESGDFEGIARARLRLDDTGEFSYIEKGCNLEAVPDLPNRP